MTEWNGYQWQNSSTIKKCMVTRHTLFELNFERYPWKRDLIVKKRITKARKFP